MASVRGRRKVNLVPFPVVDSMDIVPPISCKARATTAMPTPRPEARSASSRVEKPGVEMSSKNSRVIRRGRHRQTQLLRACEHLFVVDAAAIIGHFNHHAVAYRARGKMNDRFRRFASCDPRFRRFDAVTNRIANQMQKGIFQSFDDELVDFSLRAGSRQMDLLSGFARKVADDKGHAVENFGNSHEADAHDGIAKIAQVPFQVLIYLVQPGAIDGGIGRFETRDFLIQPRPLHHHFAGDAHQFIQSRKVHAHHVRRREERIMRGRIRRLLRRLGGIFCFLGFRPQPE